MPDTKAAPEVDETPSAFRPFRLSAAVLTLAMMILVQTATMVWWASGMSNRVATLEQVVKPLSDGSLTATLARIDERTKDMTDRLNLISGQSLPAGSVGPRRSSDEAR